jgi:hypothetical protein
MKIALQIILVISIALMVYGYWGAFTSSGNKVYDEMDGFIPFIMLIAGAILFIVSVIILLLKRKK